MPQQDEIKALDEKIKKMKQKTIIGVNKNTKISQTSKAINVVVELVSGVVVGFAIGYTLNEIFDFGKMFLIIFTILGGFAGMFNLSRYLNNKESNS